MPPPEMPLVLSPGQCWHARGDGTPGRGLKQLLAVRKVLAGKWGSLFLGYLLGKNIGGVVVLISFPGMDAADSCRS